MPYNNVKSDTLELIVIVLELLTPKLIIIKCRSFINSKMILYGSNSSNLITFNSKLSNFTMHQGAQFTITSGSLTINETNTFLNTNLIANDLTINNQSYC